MKVIESKSSWNSLSSEEKQNIRRKVRRIIERQGPICLEDIKSKFGMEEQVLVSCAVRLLIGSNKAHKNGDGLYVMDEPTPHEAVTQIPFKGYPLLMVAGVACDRPTRFTPGSEGKIQVLSARYHSGKPLWVKGDKQDYDTVIREQNGGHKKRWQPSDESYL